MYERVETIRGYKFVRLKIIKKRYDLLGTKQKGA